MFSDLAKRLKIKAKMSTGDFYFFNILKEDKMRELVLFIVFGILGGVTSPLLSQQLFSVDDFKAFEDMLTISGDAEILEDVLRLSPAQTYQQGAAWYSNRRINLERGFETEFIFRLTNQDSEYRGGDGFAFVIHNNDLDELGGFGDSIGYKGLSGGVAIEFDTYDNNEGSRNHVTLSFYDPIVGGFVRHATVHEIPELSDGNNHYARIEYKDGFLTFYLDSYIFPVLSSRLDLEEIIGTNEVWVGFTSSTSFAYADHDIIRWMVGEFLPPPDLDIDNIVVTPKYTVEVKSRNLQVSVWDHNQIDGDIISLKAGDFWIINEYELVRARKTVPFTFTGFSTTMILYAHNLGDIPPNTAAIAINDGHETQVIELQADMESSEAIQIIYAGEH